MPNYSQAGRSLQITTPPAVDQLLPVGFRGQESISQLFRFQLDLLAEVNIDLHFEDLLGQAVTVQAELTNHEIRYFNGMVRRFSQGHSDEVFTAYHAEVVPKLWLLTKTIQSRIFQNMSVPDILREVLSGYDVSFELSETYYQRNYCVQYHESDFDFASRLMEDEGIYYYFKHSESSHQMVVSDTQTSYPKVAGQSRITYHPIPEGIQEGMRIRTWEKAQELRSAQYTVRDYCFEMPTGNLEESNPIINQVKVGTVTHKLNLASDDAEVYEYPGGYAKRYDAVDSQGNAYAQGFNQMFNDRSRIVRVRMEEEECASLEMTGTSDCGNFAPGYAFTLQGHPNGDDDYLLTRMEHNAREAGYRAGEADEFTYDNRFTCMPAGLMYRPRRATPKPVIAGVQTATVTGPPGQTSSGQSVFCDQYGRVKVQFHWDRQGKMDSNSSCWLRVAQIWAGNGWGAFFWPRVGQEVVVAFEDGDPDKPIIVGSVYNAANMPPYPLPASSQLGGIRSASVSGSSGQNFNAVVFNDTLGSEHLAIHSEHNMSLNAELDKMFHSGRNKGERVPRASIFTVGGLPTGGGGGSGGGKGDGQPPPPATVVPNVLGVTKAAATTMITGAGLAVGKVTTASSTAEKAGKVLKQNPAFGGAVPLGSTVDLVVSSGPPVKVPNVVGETQDKATGDITGAQLAPAVTQASSTTVPSGTVISQDPAATTMVQNGSSVVLVVSTGPPSDNPVPWFNYTPASKPQWGFNISNTLGDQVSLTTGANLACVLGAAGTTVISPLELASVFGDQSALAVKWTTPFQGSGFMGLTNWTIGTLIDFVCGRHITVTLTLKGKNPIDLTGSMSENPVIWLICMAMSLVRLVTEIVYQLLMGSEEDWPVVGLVLAYQGLADLTQGIIMGIAAWKFHDAEKEVDEKIAEAFKTRVKKPPPPPPKKDKGGLAKKIIVPGA